MGDLNNTEIGNKKPLTRKANFAVIKRKSLGPDARFIDVSDQRSKGKLPKYDSKPDTRLKPRRSPDCQSLPSKVLVHDNSSLISTDFSHYELMRNLSASKYSCVSRSGTCQCTSDSETMSKREQIERFFQSAEKWNKDRTYDTTNNHF